MKLNTMAAVMSFVSRIEGDGIALYEICADRYPEAKETFLKCAKENKKYEKWVKQTYFGVITDTLEACYSFEGLDTDAYEFEPVVPEGAPLAEAIRGILEVEGKTKGFYLAAATVSEKLMADIPRLFKKIAKKRDDRCRALEALAG